MSEPAGSNASKPARKRNAYPDEFEASWRAYPTDANMSKTKAFDAWRKLDAQDRSTLAASIPAFVRYCQKRSDYRPVHMVKYISDRRFDGHAATITIEDEPTWRRRLIYARDQRMWSTAELGPMPGRPGCRVPSHLLQPGDGEGWQEARAA